MPGRRRGGRRRHWRHKAASSLAKRSRASASSGCGRSARQPARRRMPSAARGEHFDGAARAGEHVGERAVRLGARSDVGDRRRWREFASTSDDLLAEARELARKLASERRHADAGVAAADGDRSARRARARRARRRRRGRACGVGRPGRAWWRVVQWQCSRWALTTAAVRTCCAHCLCTLNVENQLRQAARLGDAMSSGTFWPSVR